MPSQSKAQQRLMQAAEHGASFPMAEKIRESMTPRQMHDFAVGSEKNKPEHVQQQHAMLQAHAVKNGHPNHAGTYALGALHERQGRHVAIGKHKNALMHHASGYGLSGGHAEAYADGAMNEAQGMHAESMDAQ